MKKNPHKEPLVVARSEEPPLPGPAVSPEDRAAAQEFLKAHGIGSNKDLLVMPLRDRNSDHPECHP